MRFECENLIARLQQPFRHAADVGPDVECHRVGEERMKVDQKTDFRVGSSKFKILAHGRDRLTTWRPPHPGSDGLDLVSQARQALLGSGLDLLHGAQELN